MKPLMLVGIVLVALGAVGLLYGGLTYTKNKESVDLGVVDLSISEKERLTIHPAIGGVLLIAGVAVVAASRRSG